MNRFECAQSVEYGAQRGKLNDFMHNFREAPGEAL